MGRSGIMRRYTGRLVAYVQVVESGFVEAPHWLDRARRLGPLQYSALGPRVLEPPQPAEALASWLVDFLDRVWEGEGRPDPFTAVVVSGDDGTLARAVLQLGPRCLTALRYVLVNPQGSAGTAQAAGRLLPLEEPAFLFPAGPAFGSTLEDLDADPDDLPPPAAGIGPLVTYLTGMPTPGDTVAVAAIEVLNRLPSDRLEWRDGRWLEIRMAAAAGGEGLVEIAVPLSPQDPRALRGADPPEGARFAVLTGAVAWLQGALRSAPDGILAVVDRWSIDTGPIDTGPIEPGADPPLALDQLARVREPLAGPDPLPGREGVSAVYWRIG